MSDTQKPVAWCQLSASGKIAYFDGKPMLMTGPVGNECHTTPLYTTPPDAAGRIAELELQAALERVTELERERDALRSERDTIKAELLEEHADHKQTLEDARPEPDCRLCRNFRDCSDHGYLAGWCKEGNQYEPLPPVRLWRTI